MTFEDLRRELERKPDDVPDEKALAWIQDAQREMWNRLTPDEQQRMRMAWSNRG